MPRVEQQVAHAHPFFHLYSPFVNQCGVPFTEISNSIAGKGFQFLLCVLLILWCPRNTMGRSHDLNTRFPNSALWSELSKHTLALLEVYFTYLLFYSRTYMRMNLEFSSSAPPSFWIPVRTAILKHWSATQGLRFHSQLHFYKHICHEIKKNWNWKNIALCSLMTQVLNPVLYSSSPNRPPLFSRINVITYTYLSYLHIYM